MLDDGEREYSWDAEDRLIGITYPGEPGKATEFAYDGLGRRIAITSTPPGGGTSATTSYPWCGSAICQARDESGNPVRGYYAEGEFAPGSPRESLYVAPDLIGSARRVFASGTSGSPSYDYDPFGVPLQSTPLLTDFGFAQLFASHESGLNLTYYRAYDPISGRWLSRDPFGEESDPSANLYRYVKGNSVSLADPTGLWTLQVVINLSGTLPNLFSGVGFIGVAFDTHGNFGYTFGGGLGAGIGVGLGGGVSLQGSNASTICDLAGPFGALSVGGGYGPNITGDAFWGPSANGAVIGGGLTVGTGLDATSFAGAIWTVLRPVGAF